MKSIIILAILLLISSSANAQERTFPLAVKDNLTYFNILGSGNVLMSVNTILERIDNTYGTDRNALKAKEGIQFCANDAGIDLDSNLVTGVKVLMNSAGIIKLFLTLSTGKETVISSQEIQQRKLQLASS